MNTCLHLFYIKLFLTVTNLSAAELHTMSQKSDVPNMKNYLVKHKHKAMITCVLYVRKVE